MRLTDLNPKMFNGDKFLRFDCPTCKGDNQHCIGVAILPNVDHNGRGWTKTGEYPDTLTLSPSIDTGCWHGHIVNGEIVP